MKELSKFDKEYLLGTVRDIKNFPKPGIIFKDITTLLGNAKAFKFLLDHLEDRYKDENLDFIVGIESRGFILGAALSARLNLGFVPVRKPEKLPRETVSASYDLEYGKNEVHIHADSIKPGENVVIIDDLLATGGTVEATIQLVEQLGGKVVGIAFLIELEALKSKKKLKDYNVYSVLTY